jgi:hypothetical protein
MRKKITYELPYRIDGEEKLYKIDVDFISNRVVKDFSAIMAKAGEVDDAFNNLSDLNTLMAAAESNREKGYKEKIQEYQAKISENINIIMEYQENGFLEERQDLLFRILIDNGHKNDVTLMSEDFWEDHVDPIDLIKFMTKAVYKDVDDKKKVQEQ